MPKQRFGVTRENDMKTLVWTEKLVIFDRLICVPLRVILTILVIFCVTRVHRFYKPLIFLAILQLLYFIIYVAVLAISKNEICQKRARTCQGRMFREGYDPWQILPSKPFLQEENPDLLSSATMPHTTLGTVPSNTEVLCNHIMALGVPVHEVPM